MSKRDSVIITGGSGFLGSHLSQRLVEQNYQVISLDTVPPKHKSVEFVRANLLEDIPEDPRLKNPLAVINLAGKNIFGRWSDTFKQLVYDTRVTGTRNLVAFMANEPYRPKAFVSASAAGYYGDRGNELVTAESTAGDGFLASVCQDWESVARTAETEHGIPTTVVRNGHILGGGGLLGTILPFYQWGLGGPLGSGQQWFPWVHIADAANIYMQAMKQSASVSIINATAPELVRNKEFSRALAAVLDRPHIFRIPQLALWILFSDFAEEMLYSQKIQSEVRGKLGYEFAYPQLTSALQQVVNN